MGLDRAAWMLLLCYGGCSAPEAKRRRKEPDGRNARRSSKAETGEQPPQQQQDGVGPSAVCAGHKGEVVEAAPSGQGVVIDDR